MQKNILMYASLMAASVLLCSYPGAAQDSTATAAEYNARVDSLVSSYNRQNTADEEQKNSNDLSDLEAEKRDTKAKAKEAQRVESEANDAAKQSKIAYRQEKKAQRTRAQADKQGRKAAKARNKSDKN